VLRGDDEDAGDDLSAGVSVRASCAWPAATAKAVHRDSTQTVLRVNTLHLQKDIKIVMQKAREG
jgi:hypothetical protein